MAHASKLMLVLQPSSERIMFLNQQRIMMVNGIGQERYGPMIAVSTQQLLLSAGTVQEA